jgi:mannose-6-phosphate isomerase-like protein (cupin superfamily)
MHAQQSPAAKSSAGDAPAQNAELRTAVSAAEIADRISQADAAAKAGTPYRGEPLLQVGPFRGGIQYETKAATSFAAHENDAELFVVLDGSGTITMGGTLVNPTHRGTNDSAATVDGGTARKIAKGDMILVPANTPHAFTQVDGKLVLMSMHLPLPTATPTSEPAAGPAR